MQQDDSPETPKDAPSAPNSSPEDDWRAAQLRPSRQRNMTPEQRRSLAIILKGLRYDVAAGTLESSVSHATPQAVEASKRRYLSGGR